MEANAKVELVSIITELGSVIQELESVSAGLRSEFIGIGSDFCANSIDNIIERYCCLKQQLETINTNGTVANGAVESVITTTAATIVK